MKKYCTRCGKQFEATGREAICPACKQAAAEERKKAAVLKAKRASWAGESVPVRISGRASTVIREYGKAHDVPFAEALDALLQASAFFQSAGKEWEDVKPYRSHRRNKTAGTTENTSTAQDVTSKPQEVPQEVKTAQAAKVNKTSTAKKAASTSKAAKVAEKAGKKA